MKVIIIGAGIAGMTAAKTIKKHDRDITVAVIGKESFNPYNRYILTEYLCGQITDKELYHTSLDELHALNITFRKGEYVKSVDPAKHQVKLNNNEVMDYDRLLIATGGSQHIGPLLAPFAKNIQTYYTLQDILLIKKRLDQINHCVVYGQNLSNLDLMAGMHNLGKKITLIVKDDKVVFPLLTHEFIDTIQNFLQEKGIDIITNDKPVKVIKHNSHYSVETLGNKTIKTDIVFAWDDRRPNIDFCKPSDIYKKKGILVDTRLQTSIKDIYAAGDCIEIYHPVLKNYWINFGWPNAREQGEIAGKNIAGENVEYLIQETLALNLMGKPINARWWE